MLFMEKKIIIFLTLVVLLTACSTQNDVPIASKDPEVFDVLLKPNPSFVLDNKSNIFPKNIREVTLYWNYTNFPINDTVYVIWALTDPYEPLVSINLTMEKEDGSYSAALKPPSGKFPPDKYQAEIRRGFIPIKIVEFEIANESFEVDLPEPISLISNVSED